MCATWLLKSEPGTWSWDDQVKKKIEPWDGVRNHQAANNLKAMKTGDLAFFYHSGKERRIMGIVRICKEYYPDPSDKSEKFGMVDVETVESLPNPVTLGAIKEDPRLCHIALVRQSRLSVMPIDQEAWDIIKELAFRVPEGNEVGEDGEKVEDKEGKEDGENKEEKEGKEAKGCVGNGFVKDTEGQKSGGSFGSTQKEGEGDEGKGSVKETEEQRSGRTSFESNQKEGEVCKGTGSVEGTERRRSGRLGVKQALEQFAHSEEIPKRRRKRK